MRRHYSRGDKVWATLELLSKLVTLALLLAVLTGYFHMEVTWKRSEEPVPIPRVVVD